MPGRAHHQIGKKLTIEPPNDMKVMADGKYDMKIGAIQRLGFMTFQPQLGIGCTALRTGSVFAGILNNDLVVAIGTSVDVIALGCRNPL
jgi:hypothetical protein